MTNILEATEQPGSDDGLFTTQEKHDGLYDDNKRYKLLEADRWVQTYEQDKKRDGLCDVQLSA